MLIALLASLVVSTPAPTPRPSQPPPATTNKTGSLVVNAKPWAKCRIDGGKAQTTRINAELSPGVHVIKCRLRGQVKSATVTIVAGQKLEQAFDFRSHPPAPVPVLDPSKTNLLIEATPWAKCTVAGQTRTTPIRRLVKPGTYQVVCRKGSDERKAVVVVINGQVALLPFDFRTAQPARTRVPGQDNLFIRATPSAQCSVGKRSPKTTPFSLSVKPGQHRVVCRKGERTRTRLVTVAPRQAIATEFVFGPAVAKGSPNLIVRAKPWAKCTVDGDQPRTTEFRRKVAPGVHTVVCSKGMHTKTKNVTVEEGFAAEVVMDFR